MRAKFPYEKKKKRIGFGPGSGHGKTATRGHKGQQSRTGSGYRRGFEGGQNPLYRRIPKRGFNQFPRTEYTVINLDRLAELNVTTEITPETLLKSGVIKDLQDGLKVLGNGDLKKPLKIKAHKFSEQAKKKIEAAGGQAVSLS